MRNPRSEYSAYQGMIEGQKNVRKELPVQQKKYSLSLGEAVAGLAAIACILLALSSLLR